MTLLFSSGGGRLGNQLLNMIHLIAISLEYNIQIEKLNDLYLRSKNKSFKYKVIDKISSWEIVNKEGSHLVYKFFLKIYLRLIHLSYYLLPFHRSYLIGEKNNRPRFLFGKYLKKGFKLSELVNKTNKFNIVISGWGLRDWNLVAKHKELIIKDILKVIESYTLSKSDLKINNYLLLHIRRDDFLKIDEYSDINYPDKTWLKSILKICMERKINKVVIFSDSEISDQFIKEINNNEIETIIPLDNNNKSFISLFILYVSKASFVMCNASTLAISIAFLFHEEIYLPSFKMNYQKVFLNSAHLTSPTSLNWN